MERMLIIGNGPSADTPNTGRLIRDATRVMRVNNWVPGANLGDRCDIWGTSFNVDIVSRQAPEVWWSGWPWYPDVKEPFENFLANHKDHVAPTQQLLEQLSSHCAPKYASTGLTLMAMAIDRGWAVDFAGFDHFDLSRPHHYWDPANTGESHQWHSTECERAVIAGWVAQGLAQNHS